MLIIMIISTCCSGTPNDYAHNGWVTISEEWMIYHIIMVLSDPILEGIERCTGTKVCLSSCAHRRWSMASVINATGSWIVGLFLIWPPFRSHCARQRKQHVGDMLRRRPCGIGLTVFFTLLCVSMNWYPPCDLTNVSYSLYLSFIPSSSLALVLKVPSRSFDGQWVYFEWAEESGDQPGAAIYLRINCDGVSGLSIPPLSGRVWSLVSYHQVVYNLKDPDIMYDSVKLRFFSDTENMQENDISGGL